MNFMMSIHALGKHVYLFVYFEFHFDAGFALNSTNKINHSY